MVHLEMRKTERSSVSHRADETRYQARAWLFAVLAVAACSGTACGSNGATSGGTGGTGASAGTAGAATMGGGGSSAGAASTAGTAGKAGSAGEGGATACLKCPTTCCDPGAACVDDGAGNLSCKKSCDTNSDCSSSNPCCELLKDGSGVCAGNSSDVLCRCTVGAECSSKACAPNIDAQGNPVGPYVCVQNDGAAYHGCSGLLTSCGSGLCCFTDAHANQFCASQCTNDSQCGAASCITYSNANTSCPGMLGCGPQ